MLACAILVTLQIDKGRPTYVPDPSIMLKGKKRTSAEHDQIYPKTVVPYNLTIGKLTFLGVHHTYDSNDPVLKKIEAAFNEAKPDVVLVEGRMTGYTGKLEDAAKRGEPYFVYVMAKKAGVPAYSLEPDAKTEGTALAKAESPERALMFLTLRGYQSRRRTQENVPDSTVQISLSFRAKEYGLECGLKSIADMDALWQKDFPNSPGWRKIEERDTWPGEEHTYLNRLSNVSNDVRDEHWAKTMVDLARKGKRVFVVGGLSHTINLEPVLRETLR